MKIKKIFRLLAIIIFVSTFYGLYGDESEVKLVFPEDHSIDNTMERIKDCLGVAIKLPNDAHEKIAKEFVKKCLKEYKSKSIKRSPFCANFEKYKQLNKQIDYTKLAKSIDGYVFIPNELLTLSFTKLLFKNIFKNINDVNLFTWLFLIASEKEIETKTREKIKIVFSDTPFTKDIEDIYGMLEEGKLPQDKLLIISPYQFFSSRCSSEMNNIIKAFACAVCKDKNCDCDVQEIKDDSIIDCKIICKPKSESAEEGKPCKSDSTSF